MSHPIQTRIDDIRRRMIQTRLATGVCRVLAVVLGVAFVLGTADYLFRYLDTGLQLLATVAFVLACGWAVGRFLLPALRRPISPLTVSQRVEQAFPQLENRLASSLEFLDQRADDPTAGSATLRRAVVAETSTEIDELPLEQVVDREPLRRAAKIMLAVGAVLLVAIVVDHRAVGTAAARLVAPLGSAEWPRVNQLAFRELPTRLAAGEPFEAELVDEQGALPDEVTVHYRFTGEAGTTSEAAPMQRIGDVMVARRESVARSFEIRATGGDDYSMPWQRIDVAHPPRIVSHQITVHPPAYTGLLATTAQQHLQLLAGTRMELVGTASDPLRTARVQFGSGATIDAELLATEGDDAPRQFYISAEAWVATESDAYWIEVENDEGLVGATERWHQRVEPDLPPSVTWREPASDLFVLPTAVVPVALVVKDNLQIQSIDLVYLRSDQSEAGDQTVPLYDGPPQIAVAASTDARPSGESRIAELAWQLAPLDLTPGTTMSVNGHATDYRPGLGQTPAPRRITIITRDELDQRIADRQSLIARRLEQALTQQRTTREQVGRVESDARQVGTLDDTDRDTLQTARIGQRRIADGLVDPTEGLPREIDALLGELATNGLDDSEIEQQMRDLGQTLARLADGPLPAIDLELTAAAKSLPTADQHLAEIADSLGRAAASQDEVIGTLEGLLDELAEWAGYQRFAREVAQIRKEQLALRETTGQEIGLAATTGRAAREQQANLERAAEAQQVLSRRFDKLGQDIRWAADELAVGDPSAAATLADALDLARDLGTSAKFHEATRNLQENRVGRAMAGQQQVADDLEQLLGTLRNRREHDLARLIEQLKQAESDLAQLRDELAELREDIEAAEQAPESLDKKRELERLRREADQVQEATERMARRLERLQAEMASRSTSRAADKLANNGEGQGGPQQASGQQGGQSPPSGAQARQAEQDLADAAEQLAQQRQQAEQDLQQQQMARFETAIRAVVDGQRRVLEDTQQLDDMRLSAGELTFAQLRTVLQLADQQQLLVDEVNDFGDVLGSLGVFRLALGEAAVDMQRAAGLLTERDVAKPTQQAEAAALRRLEQIAQAFEKDDPPPGEGQGGGDGGGGGGEQGPQLQLAEIKLLRMLQIDLHERTDALREQTVAADGPIRGTITEAATRLADEQGRLAELVMEILSRDNADGPPADVDEPAEPNDDQRLDDLLDQLDEQL